MKTKSSTEDKWVDRLRSFAVRDLLRTSPSIVDISASTPVPEAMRLLLREQLHAMPIFEAGADSRKKYVGLFDVIDVTLLVVMMSAFKGFFETFLTEDISWPEWVDEEKKAIEAANVGELINPERGTWCPVYDEAPLTSLMDMFSSDVNLRRAPVVDKDGKVKGIISQTDVLIFFTVHLDQFKSLASTPVSKIFASKPVVSAQASLGAREAFQKLAEHGVSALPILSKDGKIVEVLSCTDVLKSKSLFRDLSLPVEKFIARCRASSGASPLVTCTVNDTLGKVLKKLVGFRVGRVFVVNEEMKPIGVLSACDVISACRE